MDTYLLLKFLHLLGVVLFLGNIIVTGWWKSMADRTRDPKIIAFAQSQVSATDRVFTLGGIIILAAQRASAQRLMAASARRRHGSNGAPLFSPARASSGSSASYRCKQTA